MGDSYITCSNLTNRELGKGVISALKMGITLIQLVRGVAFEMADGAIVTLEARVGLHTGNVAGGILGQKRKLMCLVGDTMNTVRLRYA